MGTEQVKCQREPRLCFPQLPVIFPLGHIQKDNKNISMFQLLILVTALNLDIISDLTLLLNQGILLINSQQANVPHNTFTL